MNAQDYVKVTLALPEDRLTHLVAAIDLLIEQGHPVNLLRVE